ncbi:hypothetical protein [uncultured Desulfosarcina sp.]|nr:hypothetical protein [uncultured Desulfosarcina sp.]
MGNEWGKRFDLHRSRLKTASTRDENRHRLPANSAWEAIVHIRLTE